MASTQVPASIDPAEDITVAKREIEKRLSSSDATVVDDDDEAVSDNNKGQTSQEGEDHQHQQGPSLNRVPTSHFDPQGVRELSRRLTEISRTQSHLTLPDVTDEDNFDFEHFLKRFQARSQADGVLEREFGVFFEDLSVQGVGGGASMAPTMSDIVQLPLTIFRGIQAARHTTTKNIIEGFSGLVKPGEMLLVLGRPGAGCSTLLKSLSGYTDSFKGVNGTISYDGHAADELDGELAYLPEDDIHFPLLTVGQTLEFAAASRTPSAAARPAGMSRSDYTELLVDLYLTLFGLRQQRHTKVGNDVVRGVSGGQRKRVSIIEMLLTRAKVMAHDNSTRGLDSSTAVEYVRSLRLATDLQKTTTIASLYQCSEAIYGLFDKVCLVSNGKMLYFGPTDKAPDYFKSLGFKQYFGQTSADFLVSVTDPKARAIEEGARPPTDDAGLVEAYQKSQVGAAERAAREEYRKTWSEEAMGRVQQSRKAEAVKHARKGYLTTYWQQTRLAVRRRFQLLRGDLSTLVVQTAANIFQALIIGSVFYDITDTTAGYFSRGGVIFFAILFNALTGLAEIPALYSQRPILVRQRRFRMARPSTDALAQTLADFPVKGIVILCFDIILYWITGLHAQAGKFFTFLLFTIIASLMMVTYFRMLAAVTRQEAQASLLAGVSILVLVITIGYTIPKPSMLGWYRWFTYMNPLTYGFEALMVNEFQGYNSQCASLVPQGPGYENVPLSSRSCPLEGYDSTTGLVRGTTYLSQHFKYQFDHLWRNLGILFLFWIAFLLIQLVATELQRDEAAAASVVLFKRSKKTKDIQRAAEKPNGGDPEAMIQERAQQEAMVDEDAQADMAEEVMTKPKEVLTWRNVHYTVPVKEGHRRLLSDISGFVAPGKLTALMGESGAGKTTLLNVLAQRVNTGVVNGDILVNNHELPTSFQRQCGYAQQQDLHLEQSTVREALQFSALLRQPASTPKQEKLDYVEEIIELLEMKSFAEAIVGEPGAGLGVEQRKKLTIGVELAAKPSLLLFLDEPTSGLDSQSAWAIVQLLRKLAKHFSILCTIHQPSGELFNQFDRLLLLQRGGQVVYQGDLGKDCSTVIGYFEEQSHTKMPQGSNPAEWILEVVGAGATAKKTQNYAEVWSKSGLAEKVHTDLEALHKEYAEPVKDEMSGQTYAAPMHKQLYELTKRGYLAYWRNPTYLMAKFGLNIVGSLFIGFTFFQAPNSSSGLQVKLFAVFMALVLSNPLAQSIAPQFIKQRSLYEVREQPSRIYHWIPFTTSTLLVEIPWNCVASTVFFLCWQWTVGLTSSTERTGYMYAVFLLFSAYFASFMMALASMSPNSEIASLLFAVMFSFVIVFCGVLQPPDLMPHFWGAWMPHLATFTYIVDSLLSTAIGGGKEIVCRSSEFAIVQPTSGTCQEFLGPFIEATTGYVNNPDATSDCQYCQYRTGDEYLATVGYSYSHRPQNIGYIIAYVMFNIALLYTLYYVFRVRGSGKKADYKKGAPPEAKEGKDRKGAEEKV